MRNTTWGAIADLKYGKSLREYPESASEECRFRVFGTNGPIGWHSVPLLDQPGIIIGRKGAYRGVHYSSQPFFVIDTAYYLHIRDSQVDTKWAFYQLSTVDINRMDSGSAIPSTKREDFYAVPVSIPPIAIQRRIADILTAYDDLMENNRRRMALLEESARQLYREWFVRLRYPGHERTRLNAGIPPGWERVPLESALVLQRGFDLPSQDRQEGEVPIYGSTGINGYHSVAKVKGPGIVTGRSGTLGEVRYVSEDFWPLNTALWVKEFRRVTPLYALFLLRSLDLKQYNGGASVPTLDRKGVHKIEILLPPAKFINAFDQQITPSFDQLTNLALQNQKFRAARDHLLPRLLSGELAV